MEALVIHAPGDLRVETFPTAELGPGYFKTELTDALVNNAEFTQWLLNRTPSRRWGDVEDLCGAAVFLCSDASNFVNGHILYVDGGVTATL